jgi:serine/threonine-protein kinase RsbW
MTDEPDVLRDPPGHRDPPGADGAAVPPLRVDVPADPRLLAPLRVELAGWARDAGLPEVDVESVVLAGYEALANAAEHAYPRGGGTITLRAAVIDGEVHVRVSDQGRWRPPPADPGSRGRGLLLIRGLAERAEVRRGSAGGTTVIMVWRLAA